MDRTEREIPKPQSPLRPSPGTPAGGRVDDGGFLIRYWIYFLARLPATQGSVGWGHSDFGCGNRTCSSQKSGVRRGTLLRAHVGKAKLTPQHDTQPEVGRTANHSWLAAPHASLCALRSCCV